MGRYFGTDGFRGEANVVLTADHAYQVGRFLGWYFSKKKGVGEKCRVVIGWCPGSRPRAQTSIFCT